MAMPCGALGGAVLGSMVRPGYGGGHGYGGGYGGYGYPRYGSGYGSRSYAASGTGAYVDGEFRNETDMEYYMSGVADTRVSQTCNILLGSALSFIIGHWAL
ncbi:prion protein a [Alosa alosa]|uniref:prion protein a n=1 Tax=Alosa alosa TaxID=278164 RepID=UPI002015086F|nr:prion protein a [Alosa alosa]